MLKIGLFIYRHASLCILGSGQEERQKQSLDEHKLWAAGCNVEAGALFGVLRGADAYGCREEQGRFPLISEVFYGEVNGRIDLQPCWGFAP